ncbi:MAG: hypothetical protein ABDH61_06160 [Acidilobaceae archaeon]
MSELGRHLSSAEPLSLEQLREARRVLSVYCRRRGEMCAKYLEISSRTAKAASGLRIFELVRSEEYSGIDAGIGGLIREIEELYALYLSGIWVTLAGDPLVKLLSDLTLEGARYERGDLVALSLEKAVVLSALGAAMPVKSVAAEL